MPEELETSPVVESDVETGDDDPIAKLVSDPEARKKLFATPDMQAEIDRRAAAAAKAELENKLRQQAERDRKRKEREQATQQAQTKQQKQLSVHEQAENFVKSLDPDEQAPNLRAALYKSVLYGSQVYDAYNEMAQHVTKEVNSTLRKMGEKIPAEVKEALIEELTTDAISELGNHLEDYISAYEKGLTSDVEELKSEVKRLQKELEAARVESDGVRTESEQAPKNLSGKWRHVYTRAEIDEMSVEDFVAKQSEIEAQIKAGLVK